jgi:hypothetical protein
LRQVGGSSLSMVKQLTEGEKKSIAESVKRQYPNNQDAQLSFAIGEGFNEKDLKDYGLYREPEEDKKARDTLEENKEARARIIELLKKGKLWDKIISDELNKKHIGDKKAKEIIFLCSLGRLVRNKNPYSFNVLILSKSSAGKDHLVGSVLKLFPRLDYEIYGRTSTTALNYLHGIKEAKEGEEPSELFDYDGKILYLREIAEAQLNSEVMKEFTSGEDRISQVAITKPKGQGVDIIKILGHPCVFSTTANTIPSEEIRNRFNIVGLDESEVQTLLTLGFEPMEYREDIKSFIESLKMYDVEIPKEIIDFIKKYVAKTKIKLRFRRDFPRLLDFIRAVCIFNQSERKGHNTGTLRAEWGDYETAKEIFMNAYSGVSSIPLKDIDSRILKILEKENKPLQAKEICERLNGYVSLQALYPHLANLRNKEILNELVIRAEPLNYEVSVYVISEEYKDKSPLDLPSKEP